MAHDLTDNRLSQHVSTGAGIAIAGIWIAAGGLTALLVLVAFVWAPEQVVGPPEENLSGDGALLLLFLLALPMIAAFSATMHILGRGDG